MAEVGISAARKAGEAIVAVRAHVLQAGFKAALMEPGREWTRAQLLASLADGRQRHFTVHRDGATWRKGPAVHLVRGPDRQPFVTTDPKGDRLRDDLDSLPAF